jgi:hypothetical protein
MIELKSKEHERHTSPGMDISGALLEQLASSMTHGSAEEQQQAAYFLNAVKTHLTPWPSLINSSPKTSLHRYSML